tara:strand:+ start:1995 stop:2201 length:207 start_codon:yes stop_codon:yes gene_type:complete
MPDYKWLFLFYNKVLSEDFKMPLKKTKSGWKVISYITGKASKKTYRSKAAAEIASATSKRRSRRKRSR